MDQVIESKPKTAPSVVSAVTKYRKTNCRQFCLAYNYKTDSDIIEKLESVDSIQNYIRKLIRADMLK